MLARAEVDKWEVRFFCDRKDRLFYESELDTTGYKINNISLNEEDLEMGHEICYCPKEMIDSNYIIMKEKIHDSMTTKGNSPIEDKTF